MKNQPQENKLIIGSGPLITDQEELNSLSQKMQEDQDEQVRSIKQLRKDTDDIIQRIKNLKPSRETSLSITKLQEGVMWLGMRLKEIGTPNPYPNSKDPSNTIIEPTADGLKL